MLVLTLEDEGGEESGPRARDVLATRIGDLVHVHSPMPVVIILGGDAAETVISAVLHAHRLCSRLGVLMSVATPSAAARRALVAEAAVPGARLVVHARADIAIATAVTAAV
ncbi:hypothetical protein GCM10010515_55740 [Streptomyces fructofermentans]|uniref:Uncharacterized protein n=1 Tax=Streptomyces fructofermentans TaxID=152141 RepID=A0A918U193_9ACTN|nr:hypothetical protein GCM10010515_55740 [Streptomyces fructofermentans]